jgi:glycosyltransferase involved in cell wall biosynthesis
VNWPATSGVQRVLRHLGEEWPKGSIQAHYGFLERGRYLTGQIADLAALIASRFDEIAASSVKLRVRPRSVRRALRRASNEATSPSDLEARFDAYLLPEPSLREDNLAVAEQLIHTRRIPSFFIYYDALRLTHPQYFPPDVDREPPVIRYNHVVARADNVAFISATMRRVFEGRIARRELRHAIVARLGADALTPAQRQQPRIPTFLMVGRIEPRKRHPIVLDAFEQLWSNGRDYRLIVMGPAGAEDPTLVERLNEHSRGKRVAWTQNPTDGDVASALAQSSALVFPGDAEGYGLPPLEALAVGCPVIVSASLTALEGLQGCGQIRLENVTVDRVASAVDRLADPSANSAARREIAELDLPTWAEFAAQIEQWIAAGLKRERGRE